MKGFTSYLMDKIGQWDVFSGIPLPNLRNFFTKMYNFVDLSDKICRNRGLATPKTKILAIRIDILCTDCPVIYIYKYKCVCVYSECVQLAILIVSMHDPVY